MFQGVQALAQANIDVQSGTVKSIDVVNAGQGYDATTTTKP